MNNVYYIKAYCSNTRKPFYMRYDYAADDCWVRTYGVKELSPADSASMGGGNSDFSISNSRIGPQYKCPWCGNRWFWKHGGCGSINCWDGESDDVVCGNCAQACTLGEGVVTTLNGTSGSGQ